MFHAGFLAISLVATVVAFFLLRRPLFPVAQGYRMGAELVWPRSPTPWLKSDGRGGGDDSPPEEPVANGAGDPPPGGSPAPKAKPPEEARRQKPEPKSAEANETPKPMFPEKKTESPGT